MQHFIDILTVSTSYFPKQPPEVFYKKGALKNFAKFLGKQKGQSLFLIKLRAEGLQLY